MSTVKDFTSQSWCEECRTGECVGEHASFARYTPATGGASRDWFFPAEDKAGSVIVPGATLTAMFHESLLYPGSADDAPHVALSVPDGEVFLRAHEARQLAGYLTMLADRIEGSNDD